jgi:hypothetical protein
MAHNESIADFCRACGAPLSSIAAMDPYKQIFAQGWIYRRAASLDDISSSARSSPGIVDTAITISAA